MSVFERVRSLFGGKNPAKVADIVAHDSLRFLFERGPEAYYLADLQGHFLDGNEAAEKMIGYPREELIGRSFLKLNLLPANQIPQAAACLARCALGYAVGPEEYQLRRKDGRVLDIEITTVPVQLQGTTYVLGLARDIAERKRLASDLQKKDDRYALAVSSGRVGVWDWNGQTGDIYLDPILKKMLGYEDSEIPNRTDEWNKRIHPDDVDEVAAAVNECLEGKTDSYEIEHRMICKDGSTRWYLVRGNVVRDEKGKVIRMVGTDTDITPMKEMETELRASYTRLEELVQQRTAELKTANERLENEARERDLLESELIRVQRLSALGELSAGVSHNLNNILTGVLGPAKLLRNKVDGSDLAPDMDTIIRAGTRAADLVKRLHRAVGSTQETTSSVNLNLLVEEAIADTRPRWKDEAEGRGVEIVLRTDLDEIPPVEATPGGLYDILINLILNAVDAMPGGGEIEIVTEVIGDTVRLTVSDDGIGMDTATRERAFEPFFTTKAKVGTGLGLSTVYGSVVRWGGTIDIESEVGVGTRFVVEVPASQPLVEQFSDPDSRLPISRRARILIVEDEPFVVEFLTRILGTHHDITVLDDGDRAVATFAPDSYDVALIDLGLPGRPGDQVAEEIARRDPRVIRVLVTGWYLEPNDSRLEPFDLHLEKPISSASQARNIVAEALTLQRDRLTALPNAVPGS